MLAFASETTSDDTPKHTYCSGIELLPISLNSSVQVRQSNFACSPSYYTQRRFNLGVTIAAALWHFAYNWLLRIMIFNIP